MQHWRFLFLAIANLNGQDPMGELLIFRNVDQVMILRSFVYLGTFSQRTYGRSLQYCIFRIWMELLRFPKLATAGNRILILDANLQKIRYHMSLQRVHFSICYERSNTIKRIDFPETIQRADIWAIWDWLQKQHQRNFLHHDLYIRKTLHIESVKFHNHNLEGE